MSKKRWAFKDKDLVANFASSDIKTCFLDILWLTETLHPSAAASTPPNLTTTTTATF